MSSDPNRSTSPPAFSIKRIMAVAVLAVVAYFAIYAVARDRIVRGTQQENEEVMLNVFEMSSTHPRHLDDKFTDSNNDLIADAPADAKDQLSPEKLTFSYIGGIDSEEEKATWKDLVAKLSQVTGKPVEMVAYESTQDQLDALGEGSLHITGFNTGAVPAAVAACGFVPLCTLGQQDGTFGSSMKLIVPARSPIKTIADIKGQTVTFTTRDSNSGYKAALAMLRDNDLLPERDYEWRFSGGHDESIKGIAKGEYLVAPVSSDLLQRAIANGIVAADEIRTIEESERFPQATMGVAYNLSPELVSKIRSAFLDFDYKGTSLEKQFQAFEVVKFVPISYKQDFANVRHIDNVFHRPDRASK